MKGRETAVMEVREEYGREIKAPTSWILGSSDSWILLLLLLLAAPAVLRAQVGTDGSVLGVVKDTSDAVVPGATVTVANLETGLTKTAITDERGYFQALALPRGFYSVSVSMPGFKVWKLERTELTLGEQKRVSPVLEVGGGTEQVQVEAGVELVQTEKGSIETGIEQKQIRELPINGRNPINLVNLAPGMRFVDVGGRAREHTVQGVGQRDDQTQFLVDGMDSNDPSNEKGIAFPNLDTIAEFKVQTFNFSAEYGRNPLQVAVVTKSGTNDFHGTLWEFHRNAAVDARNAFSQGKPKLIRNLFGFTLGGPVVRNKTHFFVSGEGSRIRREQVYNSPTISLAMLRGDFSGNLGPQLRDAQGNALFDALGRPIYRGTIYDPLTIRQVGGQSVADPFPGNIIPEGRFSSASKFFFPYLVLPNSPDNRFQARVARPTDNENGLMRIDHQLSDRQRLYGRWIAIHEVDKAPGYRPGAYGSENLIQHSTGLTYEWNLSPTTLLTLAGGYLYSNTRIGSNLVGIANFTQQAGIRGFPTEGREGSVGLPDISVTGYPGITTTALTPGRFGRQILDGKAAMNLVRGKHSMDFGYQWVDHRTLARHASMYSRGGFTFNGQYTRLVTNTGDAFADYLLGLISFAGRNFPLESFGMAHEPYSALYVQDYWRIHPNLTLNLGLRLDHWHERAFVRGTGATFDLSRGKVVAGENDARQVDLSAQPVAPFLARATQATWISASDAGLPAGLLKTSSYLSPRLGFAWRPAGGNNWVVRGGYGIFASIFNGNITGSQVIGPPYWALEQRTFTRLSLQSWETAFPDDPRAFVDLSVAAASPAVGPMRSHQWNLSVQRALPFIQSAVTVSYVGNRGVGLITRHSHNDPPPGRYTDLQAVRPWPQLGPIRLYENLGHSWYNALQVKWERRFTHALGYTLAYAFARNTDEYGASLVDDPTPFAPKGYDRGRSQLERRHILNVNAIWELPFGRGRTLASDWPSVVNAALGGWQLSGIFSFVSGSPLTFIVPNNTLGNGWSTRANVVGDLRVPNPGPKLWFNPAALAAPPDYTFATSGQGLIDGPADHLLHLALMKNFYLRSERYFQVRWEVFNVPNHVNLNNPETRFGLQTTGQIFGAGAAREMQFGLKFVF